MDESQNAEIVKEYHKLFDKQIELHKQGLIHEIDSYQSIINHWQEKYQEVKEPGPIQDILSNGKDRYKAWLEQSEIAGHINTYSGYISNSIQELNEGLDNENFRRDVNKSMKLNYPDLCAEYDKLQETMQPSPIVAYEKGREFAIESVHKNYKIKIETVCDQLEWRAYAREELSDKCPSLKDHVLSLGQATKEWKAEFFSLHQDCQNLEKAAAHYRKVSDEGMNNPEFAKEVESCISPEIKARYDDHLKEKRQEMQKERAEELTKKLEITKENKRTRGDLTR